MKVCHNAIDRAINPHAVIGYAVGAEEPCGKRSMPARIAIIGKTRSEQTPMALRHSALVFGNCRSRVNRK